MPSPNAPSRVKVIGLAGGIAAGKSTVAGLFARLGAVVIDADVIAKEMLSAPEVLRAIRQAWGTEALDADGRPDRKKIAQIVFGDPEQLARLNSWVHPPTIAEMGRQLDRALVDPAVALVVVDAPLLLEGRLHEWCDAIVFVEAGRNARLRRAECARGWSAEELDQRESNQAPVAEKRSRADVELDNSGSVEETFSQVERLYNQWTKTRANP